MVSTRKLVVGIVPLAALIALLVPIIPVEVAYNEVEPYTRQCRYEVVSASLRMSWDILRGVYHVSEVTVKNVDSYGGTFTVTHYLYDVNGLYGVKQTSEYLAPGQAKTFKAEFDTRWLQDVRGEYSVSAPTIIDQRVVTKYKTIYKPMAELLISPK